MVRIPKPMFSTNEISWTFNSLGQGRHIYFFALSAARFWCIILTMGIKKRKKPTIRRKK
jgi:hypothetical protein